MDAALCLESLRLAPKGAGAFGVEAARRIRRGELLDVFGLAPRVAERSRYTLQIGENLHLGQTPGPGLDNFFNHACAPNARVCFPGPALLALADIEPGQEVRINYCATEEELFEPFFCDCHAPGCYGLVRGFKFLARREQESLKALASPWLVEKYGL